MGFFDPTYISSLDYDNLPALVPAGRCRDDVVKEIVSGWCTSRGVTCEKEEDLDAAVDRHGRAGGYLLAGVAFWDETAPGETNGRPGAPVDLADLLRMVEQQLLADGAPEDLAQRPDLYILLRGCRVYQCHANDLRIRPRFVTYAVQFDSASFFGAKFGDSASFQQAKFGNSAMFAAAKFGAFATFVFTKFGASASFQAAKFAAFASFELAKFGASTTFQAAKFGASTSFRSADLNRADLRDADLSRCDLRNVRGLILDVTRVRDAHFSPLSNDPWSVLRRAYTGPRLIFNLLFLTAFFLPYVARTGYWVGVNRTQLAATEILADLRAQAAGLRATHPNPLVHVERALESISRRLPGPENPQSRQSQVWRLVIGVDRGSWFWISAVLLLFYNVLRAVLTMFVAPMRDAEERSGVAPAYHAQPWAKRPKLRPARPTPPADDSPQPTPRLLVHLIQPSRPLLDSFRVLWWACYARWTEAYRWLIWPHRFVTALFWLAVASFLWNAWHWLMLDVWLPPAAAATS